MKRWKYFALLLLIGTTVLIMVYSEFLKYDEDNEVPTTSVARQRLPRLSPHQYLAVEYEVSFNNGSRDLCGGTILSNLYILTVAHCVYTERGPIKGPLYLVLGLWREPRRMKVTALAKRIYVPTVFHGDKGPHQHGDIAVVMLDRKLNLTAYIRSVKLPDPIKKNDDGSLEYPSYENKICTQFAYEETIPWYQIRNFPQRYREEYRMRRPLIVGEAQVLQQSECELIWKLVTKIGHGHLCGRMRDTQFRLGVCTGEPGTGLIYGEGTLIGVASFGSELCTNGRTIGGQPGVFTRVSSWMWFINAVMKNNTSVKGICDFPVINVPRGKNSGAVATANYASIVAGLLLSVVLLC